MSKERHKNVPASYLLLMQDDRVLLSRRFNTGYADGSYSLPAGHVDPGETFTQCMVREAKEEVGITLEQDDVMVAHVMHRNSGTAENNERIDAFFTAQKFDGDIVNEEPHKCDNLSWFDINNLPENILPYIAQAIDCIRNNVYYSEHGWK